MTLEQAYRDFMEGIRTGPTFLETLPLNLTLLVMSILYAYVTYRILFAWYDKLDKHKKIGLYLFLTLGTLALAYLSLVAYANNAVFFSNILIGFSTLGLVSIMMFMLREKHNETNPPTPSTPPVSTEASPSPTESSQPTTEEKIAELLRENKR